MHILHQICYSLSCPIITHVILYYGMMVARLFLDVGRQPHKLKIDQTERQDAILYVD